MTLVKFFLFSSTGNLYTYLFTLAYNVPSKFCSSSTICQSSDESTPYPILKINLVFDLLLLMIVTLSGVDISMPVCKEFSEI